MATKRRHLVAVGSLVCGIRLSTGALFWARFFAQATRNRQAAFTLFMKAYEEVRAAVQYVRHHEGDADSIIPSLFAGRGGRKKAVDNGDDKPQTPVPVPPTTNPTNTPTANPTQPAKVTDFSESGPFMHG